MKVFYYHGNKSTILLFYWIFRTTPEVSSKLYFVEICQVLEKLWLLITKELIFGFQILDLKDHFSASLSLVSIKPISTTTTTNFESKQSDYRKGWLPKHIIALFFLCRGRGVCCKWKPGLSGDNRLLLHVEYLWFTCFSLQINL